MFLKTLVRRFAGQALLGVASIGAGSAGILAVTHPASAQATFAQMQNLISCSTASACVSGSNSQTGPGVAGTSAKGYGVIGTSNATGGAGVRGQNNGASSAGVSGYSAHGFGVNGTSSDGFGVSGSTGGTGIGVFGGSISGSGVRGRSFNAEGIAGLGFVGGDFTGSSIGVNSRVSSPNAYPLMLRDQNDDLVFFVDAQGNMWMSGNIHSFARINGGAAVQSFSAKATAPTVEDTGTAQLAGGAAMVSLEPTFAASIDTRVGYRVFLTPSGDTRGLFVAARTAHGFIVHESQGGHANVSFDYRIVATAVGHAGERMSVMRTAPALPHTAKPSGPNTATAQPSIPAQNR